MTSASDPVGAPVVGSGASIRLLVNWFTRYL
jgi:hypothetical protein